VTLSQSTQPHLTAAQPAAAGLPAWLHLASEQGNYNGVTRKALAAQEPTITIAASTQHAYLSKATHAEDEYAVTVTATDGHELTITHDADGSVSRTCRSPILKTGCSGAETGSW
jgi:hypothetical protein